MTKKDYELIAEAINEGYELAIKDTDTMTPKSITAEYIVSTLCRNLERENPRFNRDKYWEACGLE